jgi:hypothetical protein
MAGPLLCCTTQGWGLQSPNVHMSIEAQAPWHNLTSSVKSGEGAFMAGTSTEVPGWSVPPGDFLIHFLIYFDGKLSLFPNYKVRSD